MTTADGRRKPVRKLIAILAALATITAAVLSIEPWLRAVAAGVSFHRLVISLLGGIELFHLTSLVVSLGTITLFGWLGSRAGIHGRFRRAAILGLFMGFGGLLGISLIEGLSTAWLTWENLSRAWSLSSSGLARDFPLPTTFPESATPNQVNLVVLGESSAKGFPCHEWLSVGRIVAWRLGLAIPERRFQAQILAHEGDTLESQHSRLSQISRRPDAVLIYCGHNEFSSRFSPQRGMPYDEEGQTGLRGWLSRLDPARFSPFCRILRKIVEHHRLAIIPTPAGRRKLIDIPVYNPSEFAERLEDYRRRLGLITDYCQRMGALPILVVPPANDADFEPNRSFLPATTSIAERDRFLAEFQAIRQSEEGDPAGCVGRYLKLLSRQPGFAEAHFRLARLLERLGRWDDAYRHYILARDHDGLPVRCPSLLQDACRQVAERSGAILVDGQALFHAVGRHGMLDDSLFHDAMHPSVRGHILLSEAILKELHARRAFGWKAEAPVPTLDAAATADHFGIDSAAWKILCERGAMFYVGFAAIRHDGSERMARKRAYSEAAARIAAGAAPESVGLPNIGIAGNNHLSLRP